MAIDALLRPLHIRHSDGPPRRQPPRDCWSSVVYGRPGHVAVVIGIYFLRSLIVVQMIERASALNSLSNRSIGCLAVKIKRQHTWAAAIVQHDPEKLLGLAEMITC